MCTSCTRQRLTVQVRAVDDSAPSIETIETTETGPDAGHTATATLTPADEAPAAGQVTTACGRC